MMTATFCLYFARGSQPAPLRLTECPSGATLHLRRGRSASRCFTPTPCRAYNCVVTIEYADLRRKVSSRILLSASFNRHYIARALRRRDPTKFGKLSAAGSGVTADVSRRVAAGEGFHARFVNQIQWKLLGLRILAFCILRKLRGAFQRGVGIGLFSFSAVILLAVERDHGGSSGLEWDDFSQDITEVANLFTLPQRQTAGRLDDLIVPVLISWIRRDLLHAMSALQAVAPPKCGIPVPIGVAGRQNTPTPISPLGT
jgi:hypothetical protein